MGSDNHLALWWEAKYKTCRAAFVAMGRMHRQDAKEHLKLMQRLQQLAYDGQQQGGRDAAKDAQFERIRQTILAHIQEFVA